MTSLVLHLPPPILLQLMMMMMILWLPSSSSPLRSGGSVLRDGVVPVQALEALNGGEHGHRTRGVKLSTQRRRGCLPLVLPRHLSLNVLLQHRRVAAGLGTAVRRRVQEKWLKQENKEKHDQFISTINVDKERQKVKTRLLNKRRSDGDN